MSCQARHPQQVTRTPRLNGSDDCLRPGDWVLVSPTAGGSRTAKVRRILSLTCAITTREQPAARWLCHFEHGGCCEPRFVERRATAAEIARAQANGGAR